MKTLARSITLVAVLGGGAMLHADTPAPPPRVLSVGDMTAKANAIRAQIGADNQKVLALKEQTRKLKDVIKLNCVNDKQIQVKAEMNIADNANDQLQTALQKSTDDDRKAAFEQLAGAGEAIRRMREEAAACVGEPELFKQEQGSTVDSPDIVDDPTQPNPFQGGEIEPPDSASR
jgi:hypothetical protein